MSAEQRKARYFWAGSMMKNLLGVVAAIVIFVVISGVIFVLAPVHLVWAEIEDNVIEVEYESMPEKDFYSRPSEWMDENLEVIDAETLGLRATELHKMSIFPGNGSFSFDAGMQIFWVVEDFEGHKGELIGSDKVKSFPAGKVVREDVLREEWYPSYWSGKLTWNPKNAKVVDIPYGSPELGPHEFIFTPPPGEYIAKVGFRENTKFIRFKIVPKGS